MKVMKYVALIISLLLCLSYTSCVRDVILDAGEAPQVVVECVISNDSIQKLYLNFTKGASKKEAEPLTKADAVLTDITDPDSLITIGRFIRQEDNSWTLDYNAVPGHHYRLEIEVPGYDLIWAEDSMPGMTQITCNSIPMYSYDSEEWGRDRFKEYYDDLNGYAYYFTGTYYRFLEGFSNSMWIYGIDLDWQTDTGPIASEIYTDISTVDNFNVKNKIFIPEAVELTNHQSGSNIKIVGVNVTNYPDLAGSYMHDRFLRIDGGRKNETFLITCNFKQWYYWYDDDWLRPLYGTRPMIFMSVSDAYDAYLKTALIMEEMQNSSDMSTIYLRDNLPSNIHGGIGVFGCKYQLTLDCYVCLTTILIEDYPKYNIGEDHKFNFDAE